MRETRVGMSPNPRSRKAASAPLAIGEPLNELSHLTQPPAMNPGFCCASSYCGSPLNRLSVAGEQSDHVQDEIGPS
jgi:hypothetical protein